MTVNPLRHLVNRVQSGDRNGQQTGRQTHRQTGQYGYQSREKRIEGDVPEQVCARVCARVCLSLCPCHSVNLKFEPCLYSALSISLLLSYLLFNNKKTKREKVLSVAVVHMIRFSQEIISMLRSCCNGQLCLSEKFTVYHLIRAG